MVLSFDEETHRYMVDGATATSVSRIATQITGKSFAGVNPEILEAARIRGETIHAEVEHNTCLFSESQWISTIIEIPNCKFEIKLGGEIHGLIVAGRADVIDEKERTIFDIKTGASKDMLYWTIQLNLYRELAIQTTGFMATSLAVLWVPKNGKYKVVEIPVLTKTKMNQLIDAYKYKGYLDKSFLESKNAQKVVVTIEGAPEEIDSVLWYLGMLNVKHESTAREDVL